MNYYIHLKSNTNNACQNLILSENGKGVSLEAVAAFAASWGKRNGTTSVSYEVSNSAGEVVEKETVIISIKPLADTLNLDSRDKFFGVLEALQQYIDNGEDADHLIEESKYDEFRAKLDAVAALRDQLDAVLASLGDAPEFKIVPKPETGIPQPKAVELHLGTSPEFTRYSKKVKALGGRYSDCRGNAYKRFVDLPWTPEGRELANKLIAEFGRGKRTTAIVRGVNSYKGKHVNAPVVVHYIDRNASDPCESLRLAYEAAFEQAFPDCLASV